jgi:hypothetical protein
VSQPLQAGGRAASPCGSTVTNPSGPTTRIGLASHGVSREIPWQAALPFRVELCKVAHFYLHAYTGEPRKGKAAVLGRQGLPAPTKLSRPGLRAAEWALGEDNYRGPRGPHRIATPVHEHPRAAAHRRTAPSDHG